MKIQQFGIDVPVWQDINKVFESIDHIEKVILYGSRAKGNYKPGSDIDLTIVGDKVTMTDLKQAILRLDDLNIPFTIDLSIRRELKHEELQLHIDRVGKVVYQRN